MDWFVSLADLDQVSVGMWSGDRGVAWSGDREWTEHGVSGCVVRTALRELGGVGSDVSSGFWSLFWPRSLVRIDRYCGLFWIALSDFCSQSVHSFPLVVGIVPGNLGGLGF